MKQSINILISGGGTGGHIYPAISISNELKLRYPNSKILFVGASDRMEMQIVPKNGFKIIGKLQQDDEYDIKVESMLGIEYENCCVAFRVMASDKNLTKYNDLYNSSYTYLNDAWDNMINIENKSRINFFFTL